MHDYVNLASVRPKQIRFRFLAEFRPFWPNFGFAETAKPLSVSVSVSAETKKNISVLVIYLILHKY